MNRRKLLKLTCTALGTNIPLCLSSEVFASQNSGSQPMVLLDKNHPYEQNIVKELFGEKVNVIPIGSDVTDLWINELKEKSQFEPLEIAGLTTESLFVCLQQLLDRENSTKFEIARVNRDLFKWKIYSNPQKTNWRQAV